MTAATATAAKAIANRVLIKDPAVRRCPTKHRHAITWSTSATTTGFYIRKDSLNKPALDALSQEGDIGFLIPADGDSEDLFFTAIDMDQIKRNAKYSKAKHMLFLVDACYGGLAAVNTRSLSTSVPNFLDKVS